MGRSFEFRIRVRDVPFWSRVDVQAALRDCLLFMTGDSHYVFRFEAGHTTPPTSLFDTEEFVLPQQAVTPEVQLFSGGLDSLAGAIGLLEEGHTVCLVSHRSQPGTMRTQTQLFEALAGHVSYRGRVRQYHFGCTLTGTAAVEETQRSRAFLYTSIACALQIALGGSRIHVFENGVTSLNLPRREDQANARASRTTHPKTVRLLEALFGLVAERPMQIVQPFLWDTKVDVLNRINRAGHGMLVASSVSCSETRMSRATSTQCGACFQCIDRRLAAFASHSTNADHAGLYARDVTAEPLQGKDRTVVIDYIRQAREFRESHVDGFAGRYANELVDITEGLEPLGEPEAVERVWRLCRSHGQNVQKALCAIQEQCDDPYAKVVPGSLVDLIRTREYLREPTTRAVEAFIERAERQIERLYGGGHMPENENEFNRGVAAILGAVRSDLESEHPAAHFACAGVTPDHELGDANVVVESKYIRSGTPPSRVSRGVAEDLCKYPQNKHILFVVYDPNHEIRDTAKFIKDFESRGGCTVRVLR